MINSKSTKISKAFTLIELLVVISIIAVLMAIMMPALRAARERAKRVMCSSNLHSIHQGLVIYAEDYDQKLPPRYIGGWLGSDPSPWAAYIAYDSQNPKNQGSYILQAEQLARLYGTKASRFSDNRNYSVIDNPELFYCPSQPQRSDWIKAYNYSYYSEDGDWNKIPQGDSLVRTSYSYWTHGEDRFSRISSNNPIVFDCIVHWDAVPHKTGNKPSGLNTLFADGSSRFCSDEGLFDEKLWNPSGDWDVNRGPGNNKEAFNDILKLLR